MIIRQQRQTAMQTTVVRPTKKTFARPCYGVLSFHRSSATTAATWAVLPVKPVLLVFALDHTSPPASAGHACQRVLTLDNARLYLPTPAHAGFSIHSRPYTHPHKHTFHFGRRSHPRQACSTPVSGLGHVCSASSSTKKPFASQEAHRCLSESALIMLRYGLPHTSPTDKDSRPHLIQ